MSQALQNQVKRLEVSLLEMGQRYETMADRYESMAERYGELLDRVRELESKRKPGRPRKDEQED